MERLEISFMKELRIFAFIETFSHVNGILDSVELNNVVVEPVVNKFKSHEKKLIVIKSAKLRHPLTRIIQEHVRIRTEYLGSLRLKVDSGMLSNRPKERVAAARLKVWLHNFKKDLYPPSISAQGWNVKVMMDEVKHDAEIREAIAVLDLEDLLADIAQHSAEIEMKDRERLKNINENAYIGQELREDAYIDFKRLINALDIAHSTSEDDTEKRQLEKINGMIHDHLVMINSKAKSRKTIRKNKKDNASAVKDLINSELKEGEQNIDKTNLPMIIYNEMKIPNNVNLPSTTTVTFQ